MIEVMDDFRVFINQGPIQMMLDVSAEGNRLPDIGTKVGEKVLEQFHQMLPFIEKAKQYDWSKMIPEEYPLVLKKMIHAVITLGEPSYTPLAAVAGSFSEFALETALSMGAGRVIVNNGGDIAFRDIEGRPVKVGIPLEKELKGQQLVMSITDEMGIRGICTSGFGGRSFTKGIADKAVALASKASIADVCATYIANETNVEDPAIIRSLAEEIDSGTDLKGHLVTVRINPIKRESILKALLNGHAKAEELIQKQKIIGSAIVLGQDVMLVPDGIAQIKK